MPLNSTSLTSLPPEKILEDICRNPWKHYLAPFEIAPKVFYVSGNDWVGCYLIDTEEGLILIDTAMHESCYLMIESIRSLGYDPKDIKKILLSHAHIDHIGAARTMKELTGAKVYIGKRDVELLTTRKDLILSEGYTCGDIIADETYDDETPIKLGNTIIHTYSTPGHTPGCTSFVFEREGKDGKRYTCAMHGGVGLNTVSRKFLQENNLPLTLQQEFLEQFIKMDKLKVDICIPSHTNQVGIVQLIPESRNDYTPFIDSSIWHELMNERIERVKKMLASELL